MTKFAKAMNALLIFILVGVLSGGFFEQFYYPETPPCPLCILQRASMVGIALGALLNLKFRIHVYHYAICYLYAILGASISIRQIVLHICPNMPQFGIPVFGLGLYTWAFLVFACTLLGLTLLLFFLKDREKEEKNGLFLLSFFLLFFIISFNIISTLFICKLGPCQD